MWQTLAIIQLVLLCCLVRTAWSISVLNNQNATLNSSSFARRNIPKRTRSQHNILIEPIPMRKIWTSSEITRITEVATRSNLMSNSTTASKVSTEAKVICRANGKTFKKEISYDVQDCVLNRQWPGVNLNLSDSVRSINLVFKNVQIEDLTTWNAWVRQLKNNSFLISTTFHVDGNGLIGSESLPFGSNIKSFIATNLDWNRADFLQLAKVSNLTVKQCSLENVSLTEIPKLPWNITTEFDLRNNDISELLMDAFDSYQLSQLTYLYLPDSIYYLEFGAFTWSSSLLQLPFASPIDSEVKMLFQFKEYARAAKEITSLNSSLRLAIRCCSDEEEEETIACQIANFTLSSDGDKTLSTQAITVIIVCILMFLVVTLTVLTVIVKRHKLCLRRKLTPLVGADRIDDHELLCDNDS